MPARKATHVIFIRLEDFEDFAPNARFAEIAIDNRLCVVRVVRVVRVGGGGMLEHRCGNDGPETQYHK